VILIAPYWATYADQVELAGGVPVVVQTTADQDFAPSAEQIIEKISAKTKAIMLNSPCNPTGAAIDRPVLEQIAELAIKHDFWVISDEIYEKLVYGFEPASIASFGPEALARTVTINGCSKTYSMTGWRIGYACAPKAVATAMASIQDNVTSGAVTFCQAGAVAALKLPDSEIEAMREIFDERRKQIIARLRGMPGVKVTDPRGAFYAFPDLSHFIGGKLKNDLELAEYLLNEAHIATVPGSAFHAPGHVRFSFACSPEDIDRGMTRLEEALAQI
jgi:aspartate aminotransferase